MSEMEAVWDKTMLEKVYQENCLKGKERKYYKLEYFCAGFGK